jgi:uncharacterized membrane protein HdeD (DUF308 family)
MRTLGIILVVAGLLAIALPYVTFTTKEKVLDIGPIEAVQEKKHSVPVSPLIGTVVLVAGVVVIVAGGRK